MLEESDKTLELKASIKKYKDEINKIKEEGNSLDHLVKIAVLRKFIEMDLEKLDIEENKIYYLFQTRCH